LYFGRAVSCGANLRFKLRTQSILSRKEAIKEPPGRFRTYQPKFGMNVSSARTDQGRVQLLFMVRRHDKRPPFLRCNTVNGVQQT
jgi:hypothetical protein